MIDGGCEGCFCFKVAGNDANAEVSCASETYDCCNGGSTWNGNRPPCGIVRNGDANFVYTDVNCVITNNPGILLNFYTINTYSIIYELILILIFKV